MSDDGPSRTGQSMRGATGDRVFKISGLSGPQIHVDPDKIAAIGHLAEIDDRSIGRREYPSDFGYGCIQGHVQ
jgi:hypothetical protein